AEAAAAAVRATFTDVGFGSQSWVSALNCPGARLL
ncbi:homoserine kinase, partial [Xanthomonas oryzae pv. oryzae]